MLYYIKCIGANKTEGQKKSKLYILDELNTSISKTIVVESVYLQRLREQESGSWPVSSSEAKAQAAAAQRQTLKSWGKKIIYKVNRFKLENEDQK